MPLIVDGYNLICAAGILGGGVGPGTLERSRLALLNFLAESLDPKEIAQTTVVFDASDAPPGRPRTVAHRGICVQFASQYADADTLMEELIRADSAPRRLTVVSSDHRIQRAARRRRATAVDSDVWYAQVLRRRVERDRLGPPTPARPPVPLLSEDVDYWVRQFGGESALAALMNEQSPASGQPRHEPAPPQPPTSPLPLDKPAAPKLDNPFPPGYAEDLEQP